MPNNKSITKPETSTIRLFVVDPSMNFRSLIRKSVGGASNIEIVGSAGSYEHGIDAIKQTVPSVILLALPEIRSEVIEQIDEIRQFNDHAKFIVSIPKKFTITAIMKLTGLPLTCAGVRNLMTNIRRIRQVKPLFPISYEDFAPLRHFKATRHRFSSILSLLT